VRCSARSCCSELRTVPNQLVDNGGYLDALLVNQMVEQGAVMAATAESDDRLSRVFGALADPTRRDIVARLTVGDATVSQLGASYDVSLQAVSKHLKVLEEAGLVSRSREAQRRPVHLEAQVFDLMTKWIERYRLQAEERYRRLDSVLAAMDETDNEEGTPS
jgi:DNA-binding transcriptional ArsR family regulator